MDERLTHVDERGQARMVDVSDKAATRRDALAESVVHMKAETLRMILSDEMQKGDVFACARIAGILAAKRTSELIPLCHPIALSSVCVDLQPEGADRVRITAAVSCEQRTGAEMEALTAASIAALTLYDMCKAVDRGMEITHTRLIRKSGGKSGLFVRDEANAAEEA